MMKISKDYFREVVEEYIEIMELSPEAAYKTAIEEFEAQNADLSDIIQHNQPSDTFDETQAGLEMEAVEEEPEEDQTPGFLKDSKTHLQDRRQELYLQSDRDLKEARLKNDRIDYKKGSARKLMGKGLSLCFLSESAFVIGQSNHHIVLFTLPKPASSLAAGPNKHGQAQTEQEEPEKVLFFKRQVFRAHQGPVSALASITDALFISGSWDHRIYLWSTAQKDPLFAFEGHTDYIKCLKVLEIQLDRRTQVYHVTFFSSSVDNTIRKWACSLHFPTLAVTQHACVALAKDLHARRVEDLCVLNENALLSVSSGTYLSLWDPATLSPTEQLKGHETSVYCTYASEDFVFTGSADKTVIQWRLVACPGDGQNQTLVKVKEYKLPDWIRALAGHDKMLYIGLRNGEIYSLEITSQRLSKRAIGEHFDGIDSMAVGPSPYKAQRGRYLYSTGWDGTVRTWCI